MAELIRYDVADRVARHHHRQSARQRHGRRRARRHRRGGRARRRRRRRRRDGADRRRDSRSSPAPTSSIFGTLKTREQSLARSRGHARAAEADRGRRQAARRGDPRQRARRRPRSGDVLPLPRDGARRDGRPARGAARHHPRRRRHAAPAAAVRRGDSRSRCAPRASRCRRRGRWPAGIVDQVVDGDLLDGAIAFAQAKAASRGVRRDARAERRQIANRDGGTRGVRSCARRRWPGSAKGVQAPFKAVDAIEAALTLDFDAGSARERELFADCVVSTESRALVHMFFADREAAKVPDVPKDTPVRDHRARRRHRRRHHGRRHRHGLRQRRHSGAAQGRRRGRAWSAAWRPSARTTSRRSRRAA